MPNYRPITITQQQYDQIHSLISHWVFGLLICTKSGGGRVVTIFTVEKTKYDANKACGNCRTYFEAKYPNVMECLEKTVSDN
ncbi:Uncharacterised protein [Candidatus Venteria ishoeyi]|uniref:Uncharacterized protein n=1 Tax=Candidatus Venteria ishoeyi TaxID=1899563 RepID=A0A1H6FAJ4_9GAMM|nr:Uncharacterised protein [Candidatus Venteria ishoeyi]